MRNVLAGFALIALVWTYLPINSADGNEELRLHSPSVVLIKSGWFTMGSFQKERSRAVKTCLRTSSSSSKDCRLSLFNNEGPAHSIYLTDFRIDRVEVSNFAYRRCVIANQCSPSRLSDRDTHLAQPDLPVVGITWTEAQQYCHFRGGQLPTEAQWERAARGSNHRQYPWGQIFNSQLANHGSDKWQEDSADGHRFASKVDGYPDGKSPFGLLNMAGNVWEFTADKYADRYSKKGNRVNPTGPEQGRFRVIRGGSWRSPIYSLRSAYRGKILDNESRPDTGFRCAYRTF